MLKRINPVYVIILLFILGFTLYANSLKGEFLLDDRALVVKNPYIKNWNNITRIFSLGLFYNEWGIANYYRPLQTLSFMVDYSLWKLHPFGYHLTNVLLHTLCSICVFYLILLITKDKLISLITSLFFLIHPVLTASVSYISGRADSMGGILFILSLIFYIKSVSYPRLKKLSYSISVLCFILALLSKEMTIILPLILLLYDFTFQKDAKNLRNKILLRYLPFFIVAIIYISLRLTILNLPGNPIMANRIPLYLRLLTFSKVIFIYLGVILLPFNLHMERTVAVAASVFEPAVFFSLIGLFFIVMTIIKSRKYSKIVFFGVCWFFIALLPMSNIVPLLTYLAEHWLYLPFIGIAAVAASGINRAFKYLPKTTVIFFILLSIFYSVRTVNRNNDWKTEIGFYKQTLKYAPNSFTIRHNLGDAYRNKKMYEKAIEEYNIAIKLRPSWLSTYHYLGCVYEEMGKFEEAIELYNRAKTIGPRFAAAYVNSGNIYFQQGQLIKAIDEYGRALELEPYDHEVWSNLGDAYRNNRDYSKAIEVYKKTLKLNPGLFNVHNNLGAIYLMENRLKEAIEEYKTALKLNPDSAEACFNLGIAYAKSGEFDNARRKWMEALKIDPNLKQAEENLKGLEQIGYGGSKR